MRKTVSRYLLPIILFIVVVVEWGCVLFVGGVLGVVSWWAIMWGSIIGLIIFILSIMRTMVKSIRHKKADGVSYLVIIISLIVAYPFSWIIGVGQMAYPVQINDIEPAVSIRVPFHESAVVGWGGDSVMTNRPHVIVPMERWAYDLLMEPYSIKEAQLDKYGIYNVEVISPINATVVQVYDQEDDILPGAENNETMLGNYIYLKIENTGTYLILAHLKKGSIIVEEGQRIKEGTPIARVGNSGSTSEPHLHIHHQRQNPKTTSIFLTEGLPLYFRDVKGSHMPSGGIDKEVIWPEEISR